MAIFGPKPWVTPFTKISIFSIKLWKIFQFLTKTMCSPLWKNCNFWTSWTSCFYSLERRFFALEYRKSYFLWPILPKNKSWKNGWFGTKTMSIFRLFEVVLIIFDFTLNHHQTSFSCPVWQYTNFEEIWNFDPKS